MSNKSKKRSKVNGGAKKFQQEIPTNSLESETQINNTNTTENGGAYHAAADDVHKMDLIPEKVKVAVHVCSFFEWIPSSILSLAYSKSLHLLAVGKANGDIELWTTQGRWFMERVIKSMEGIPAKSIAWSKGRLFTSALSGHIVEWDLNLLKEKRVEDSYGGAVWDIASNADGTMLAAACDDGCVRLYNVETGLSFYKSLHAQKEKTLCVAWHPDGNDIFTGGSEGIIRRFDLKTGANVVYSKLPAIKSKAAIWTIKCMSDFTVIVGDSNGFTHFADGQFCIVNHSYKQHQADVLCIAVDEYKETVYSSGIDSKVEAFQKFTENGITKWVPTCYQRINHLDTRALVMVDTLLISGGNENRLVLYSTKSFDDPSSSKKFSPYPSKPLVSATTSHKSRLLLCRHDRKLELWRLGLVTKSDRSVDTRNEGESLQVSESATFLLALTPKLGNLVCSAISPDGTFIACSDRKSMKLYNLKYSKKNAISITKFTLPPGLGPAYEILFTVDSSKLIIATPTAGIHIFDLSTTEIIATFTEHQQFAEAKGLPIVPITTLALSKDGKYLASGDLNNVINTYSLQTLRHNSTLPIFDSRQVALEFHPTEAVLSVLCGSKQFYLYDVAAKAMHTWSRENTEFFDQQYFSDKSSSIGIKFHPTNPDLLLLYSDVVICSINLQKRTFKFSRKYRGIMFAGFLDNSEMILVERTWRIVMASLPEPLFRVRYGT